ncbi:glycosyltransferase family 39 protein [Imhoffiella purpurea]|uniref:Glycosyltransferase RgtA/B/C/D-like domain-containing protein n=1 Tax=Imhoffiella purpurea TaxID=1249627 RepID=W9V6L8_9GAMM|nr:glycosyltransferase family 39 protein [Imhoffiella purpurea]EXJ15029.1 hypothetical protein D779_1898 [Imhoffiella purpurea]
MERPSAPTAVAGRTSAADLGVSFHLIAGAIVLVAASVRLFGLDHLLVWHDEVFTLIRVFGYAQAETLSHIFSETLLTPADLLRYQMPDPSLTWADAMAAFASHPEHAPLYYILTRLATGLPVEPIVAARGLSALFGVLLIPAIYWLMRELFGRGPVPWVAAILVACSPLQLLYAQEARQYALWMLMLVVSSAALVRALRHDRRGDWWIYGISVVLGCYTHLLFLLMIPVHGLFGLADQIQARRPISRVKVLAIRWSVSVLAAVSLFSPWLWVLARGQERVDQFTAWMTRPIGLTDILAAWSDHLAAAFVDLSPGAEPWWGLLLMPLIWALWRFLRLAPRSGMWMLLLTLVVYVGVVLGPDLLLGGSRSLHVRYALPAILAVQLMVAWVIGQLIAEPSGSRSRRVGVIALAVLVVLGALSESRIMLASTWSNKNFSASNLEVAEAANAGGRTLVLASASRSGIATGELISLAYRLQPQVRIWGDSSDAPPVIPPGFDRMILLSPSEALLSALGPLGTPIPLAGTWQWFILDVPGGGSKPGGAIDSSQGT